MELILIRHAKAEDQEASVPDIERHLTDKGKAKFKQLTPQLKEHTGQVDASQFVSWSSPANRAQETAEIALTALDLPAPEIHECIYTGDLEQFTKALQAVSDSDDATLLVFGHEPTLSDWVETFTGQAVRMKKGSMVSITLSSKDPIKGQINWQIKP